MKKNLNRRSREISWIISSITHKNHMVLYWLGRYHKRRSGRKIEKSVGKDTEEKLRRSTDHSYAWTRTQQSISC
jgi:hypothetical protein